MLQPRLIAVKPLAGYKLQLTYETGEIRIFDASPYIGGSWFGELADQHYFDRVRIIGDGAGVEWPHGQDIAPHELYEN